jgi:hypothetical protein
VSIGLKAAETCVTANNELGTRKLHRVLPPAAIGLVVGSGQRKGANCPASDVWKLRWQGEVPPLARRDRTKKFAFKRATP